MKKKCTVGILSALLMAYALRPDYKIEGSFKVASDNYTESTVKVQTYGSFLTNPDEIMKEHVRVNDMPSKLIIEMYAGAWKYRTVVYSS